MNEMRVVTKSTSQVFNTRIPWLGNSRPFSSAMFVSGADSANREFLRSLTNIDGGCKCPLIS